MTRLLAGCTVVDVGCQDGLGTDGLPGFLEPLSALRWTEAYSCYDRAVRHQQPEGALCSCSTGCGVRAQPRGVSVSELSYPALQRMLDNPDRWGQRSAWPSLFAEAFNVESISQLVEIFETSSIDSLQIFVERMCGAAPVRELARWLGRRGQAAYLLPESALPRTARYVPHIYTDAELAALFGETDRCHYCSQVPLRHLVMPVLFRTIYASGLRCSEARMLRVGDVDVDTGVLQIRDAKGGKDRQVPVSETLHA